MRAEENKALIRDFWDELWNKGNLDIVDKVYAPDYVGHDHFSPQPITLQGRKEMVAMNRKAFPDIRTTVDDQIAEGDFVVSRWSARGTHKGDLMGIPPSGKAVTLRGITTIRFVGGKIAEQWENWDSLGMLQQLGVVPTPGQSGG